ncbi:hypothetical protein Pcinc_011019 [Petrolisthes cinctipes]|nr:hypothetical protein Pcinc_011019 [Petrolisthes cinctipes]
MLNCESLSRYTEKCKEIGNIDPYNIPRHAWKDITTLLGGDLPDLRHSDIYQYLINFKSAYNHKELRAYRSLEAYKYFIAGWVSELLIADIKQGNGSTLCIVTAKVRHSQSLNEEALRPWFAMEKEGPIIAAHCSCVAGLGEACSHVAATMFAVESGANWTKKESCTSQPCGWVLPSCSSFKSAPLAKIDFTSPATKYKNFDK